MRKFCTQCLYVVLFISSWASAANQTSSVSVVTSIPISCQFSNVSPQIVLSEEALVATGIFNLQCNQKFELQLSTKSLQEGGNGTFVKAPGGTKLKTLIQMNFIGNVYQLDAVKKIQVDDPASVEQGTIHVKLAEPVQSTMPKGVYQDVLYLDVTF